MIVSKNLAINYSAVSGDINMNIDSVVRKVVQWDDWVFTIVVDGSAYRQTAWKAIIFHQPQAAAYGELNNLSKDKSIGLWEKRSFTVHIVWSTEQEDLNLASSKALAKYTWQSYAASRNFVDKSSSIKEGFSNIYHIYL
jgi:hypothetical protein